LRKGIATGYRSDHEARSMQTTSKYNAVTIPTERLSEKFWVNLKLPLDIYVAIAYFR
jgi:hypothetical protein